MRNYLQRFRRYFSNDPGGGYGTTPSATEAEEDDQENDVEGDEEADEEGDAMLEEGSSGIGGRGSSGRSRDDSRQRGRRASRSETTITRLRRRRSRCERRRTATSPSSSPSKHYLKPSRETNSSPGAGGGTTTALESSEEEESSTTARLSRRSSVLVDLFALFRRSSSIGFRTRFQPQRLHDTNDLDESEEEEEEQPETMSKDQLLRAIRAKKEIIGKVRLQPWSMRRKRRTLKVAQRHLKRQKARVSRWHLYKVELQRRGKQLWRWIENTAIYLIPWESKIKRIESHFGSVVSSYFIFLRWVLGLNAAMSSIVLFFIVIPEWLSDSRIQPQQIPPNKVMSAKVAQHADELNTVLDFGGHVQYSYLFYGFYSANSYVGSTFVQYRVPIAYFCASLFLLAFCLFTILRKMTSNTRKSKLSGGKQEQYVFSWKIVNGWDYSIGNSETSSSLFKANVIKMREAIAEYNKRIKQKLTCLLLVRRVMVNMVILLMFAISVYAIYAVAQMVATERDTFIKQNAVSITVALITLLFPPIFELILKLEGYRPRTALRTHLFRVLIFYLINYFTLVYSLFIMLNTLEAEMRASEQKEANFRIVHNPYYEHSVYQHAPPSRHPTITYHYPHLSPYENGNSNNTGGTPTFYELMSSGGRRKRRRKGEKGNRLRRSRVPRQGPQLPPAAATPTVATMPSDQAGGGVWTTVEPNYGPFGVGISNPKVIVAPIGTDKKGRLLAPTKTTYESRPVGPSGDWSAATTQGPVTLNYTTTPRAHYSHQAYRASNYDDLCWETLIGQEIAKIVTTDLVLSIVAIMVIDFLRGLWVRHCTMWWCWSLETTFPEYGEFKVAENVLHLVNNQGMVWLGTILVPMLPILNNVKLIVLMYIRAWACMTCNVPARQIFRASRSSNFYLWLLLMMLVMSTLPVGFVIASKRPSKNCGPFSGQPRFYSVISDVLHNNLNRNLVEVILYVMSPGIVIPILLLMLLIIYFLVLLVNGLKAANSDLSKQLTHERTEEKKKIFELAGGGKKRPSQYTILQRPSTSPTVQEGSGDGSGGSGTPKSKSGSGSPKHGSTAKKSPSTPSTKANGLRSSWPAGTPKATPKGSSGNRGAGEPSEIDRRSYHDSSPKHSPQSPSKSPTGQTRFQPSLQRVNEGESSDEEETCPTPQTIIKVIPTTEQAGDFGVRRPSRDSATNHTSSSHSHGSGSGRNAEQLKAGPAGSVEEGSSEESKLPIQFTLKQRLLMMIGLADREELEAEELLRRTEQREEEKERERGAEKAERKKCEADRRKPQGGPASASAIEEVVKEAESELEEANGGKRRRRPTPIFLESGEDNSLAEEVENGVVTVVAGPKPRLFRKKHETPRAPLTSRWFEEGLLSTPPPKPPRHQHPPLIPPLHDQPPTSIAPRQPEHTMQVSAEDPTLPPSGESSFRDPTPPHDGVESPIYLSPPSPPPYSFSSMIRGGGSGILSNSFCRLSTNGGSYDDDQRLMHTDLESSYAAAMRQPILPGDLFANGAHLPRRTDIVSNGSGRLGPVAIAAVEPQPRRPLHVSAEGGGHLQEMAWWPAQRVKGVNLPTRVPPLETMGRRQPQTPPSTVPHGPARYRFEAPTGQRQPSLPLHHLPPRHREERSAEGYRRHSPRPPQISASPSSSDREARGGSSTSGRGTLPPAGIYYTTGDMTSPSPASGSSREFGRSKFRISSSPTRRSLGRGNAVEGEAASNGQCGGSLRRYQIRQRPALDGPGDLLGERRAQEGPVTKSDEQENQEHISTV